MPSRNLGSLPLAQLRANEIDWSWFVRVDIASPVGTQRFTDRYCGRSRLYPNGPPGSDPNARTVSLAIDGSTQTWSETDVVVSTVAQGQQRILSVSSLSFANLEETPGSGPRWTGWANNPGLSRAAVKVWHVRFDPQTSVLVEKFLMYDGKVGAARYGDRAELSLKTGTIQRRVPYMTAAMLGAAAVMPLPDSITHWGENNTQLTG